jgi:hypothetical protein
MSGGFGGWSRRFLPPDGRVYLDGRLATNWLEVQAGALMISCNDALYLVQKWDGSSAVQTSYRGPDQPLLADRKTFTTGFLLDDEADAAWFERTRSMGRPVTFFPGDFVTESFRAQAGQVYRLLRTPAPGIVPGVSLARYPVTIAIDDIEDPGAATVTGREVAASADGVLSVTYSPIYQVILQSVQIAVTDTNKAIVSVTMPEVIPAS